VVIWTLTARAVIEQTGQSPERMLDIRLSPAYVRLYDNRGGGVAKVFEG
jgi:hypothetical protein